MVKGYVYNSVAFVLSLSVLVSILLIITSVIILRAKAPELSTPVIIVAFVLPLYVLAVLSTNVFQGLGRMMELGMTTVTNTGVKVVSAIVLVYMGFGLIGAITSFLFGSIFALMFAISRFKRNIGFSTLDFKLVKKIVFFSLQVSMIVVMFNIILRSDSILLKLLSVPNQIIGFYVGSALISRVVFYLSQAIAITLLPMVSSKKIRLDTLKKPTFLLVLLMLLLIMLSSFYKEQIISLLFPETFVSVSYILPLLLLAMSTLGISYIVMMIPIGIVRPDVGLRTCVLGFLIYIASFFTLVPRYGIIGSALSILFGALAILVSTTLLIKTSEPSASERILQ